LPGQRRTAVLSEIRRLSPTTADSGDVNKAFRRSEYFVEAASLAIAIMTEGYSHRQVAADAFVDFRNAGFAFCPLSLL